MRGVALRPEADVDLEFLQGLYASSREREMAMLPAWTDEQKREFLDSQFSAQRSAYRGTYPDAHLDVIELDGRAIGRIYVAERRRELVLMDITLLAAERGAGIGTRLCKDVMAEAERLGKIVSLHVEDDNPARRLYDRLGFVEVAAVTFYKRMHWAPSGLEHISEAIAAEIGGRC